MGGDIDHEDLNLSVLKAWVTEKEADEVLQMLDVFIAEVPVARARRVMETDSSWSLPMLERCSMSSMKMELLNQALPHVPAQNAEDMDGDGGKFSDEDGNPSTETEGKHKMSHRQRKRKAKAIANIPKTPSVVSQ